MTSTFRQLRYIPLFIMGFSASYNAAAQTSTSPELLDILVEKQILTESQAEEIRQAEKERRSVNNAVVDIGSGGLKVKSADGRSSFQFGGRLHADAAVHDHEELAGQQDGIDGTQIRRARLYAKGDIGKQWSYLIEADFAGNKTSLKDATLGYHFSGLPLTVTVGNQKQAVSMEIEESSNDIPFIERSLVAGITTPYFDRAIGITAASGGDNWHFKTGLFGDGVSDGDADEGTGFGLRATYAPIVSRTSLLHVGGSFGLRNTSDDGLANGKSPGFSYKTTNFSDLKPVSASIADMEQVQTGVFELAAMCGPWTFQSEYAVTDVSRETGDDLSFSAYYAQVAYLINGQRRYKAPEGEFKYPSINADFNPEQGHWGAVELAARLDHIDLEDGDISGGEADRITLALNWYLNRNVRMMLDYSHSYELKGGALQNVNGELADDIDTYAMRVQLSF